MLIAVAVLACWLLAARFVARQWARLSGRNAEEVYRSWEQEFPGLEALPNFASSLLWILNWPSLAEVGSLLMVMPVLLLPTSLTNWLDAQLQALVQFFADWRPGNVYLKPTEGVYTYWSNVAQGLPPAPSCLSMFPAKRPCHRINAEVTAYLAQATYERPKDLDTRMKSWSFDKTDAKLLRSWTFDRVPRTNDTVAAWVKTTAFLFSVRNSDGRGDALVLAFRGTEALSGVAWLCDFVGCTPPSADWSSMWPYGFFHRGFMNALGLNPKFEETGLENFKVQAYSVNKAGVFDKDKHWDTDEMWDKVLSHTTVCPFTEMVNGIAEALQGGTEGARLYVTGHSLGAALANLFTAAILVPHDSKLHFQSYSAERTLVHKALSKGATYTWAQPRVGGRRYARLVEAAANKDLNNPKLIRIVNTDDVVPRVPPPIGSTYQHSGVLLMLPPNYLAPDNRTVSFVQEGFSGLVRLAREIAPEGKQDKSQALRFVEEQNGLYGPLIFQDMWVKLYYACTSNEAALRGKTWLRWVHILSRLVAAFGGYLLVIGLGLLWLTLLAPAATALTFGAYAALWPVDLALVAVMLVFMGPVVLGPLVDHSMLEYYTATLMSGDPVWDLPDLADDSGPAAKAG